MGTWQDRSLFAKPTAASIHVPPNQELVRLTALISWRDLINIAVKAREQSRKRLSGTEPRYRQLLGAVVLMAVRGCNYRDAEDLVSYYAPARHLCDLMDSNIRLDHVTIFEFTQMLGEGGMESINKVILQHAAVKGTSSQSPVLTTSYCDEWIFPISLRLRQFPSSRRSIIPTKIGSRRPLSQGLISAFLAFANHWFIEYRFLRSAGVGVTLCLVLTGRY